MKARPRKILALDCSFGGHSVAVATSGGILAECHHPRTLPSEGIIKSIEQTLGRAQTGLGQLDCIAFGSGPGLFSGIRAACTAAQGIAHVYGLQTVAVPTAFALAEIHSCMRALVVYPAHRDHCYIAALERQAKGWHEVMGSSLYTNDNLPALPGEWNLCGRRLARLRHKFTRVYAGRLSHCQTNCASLAGTVAQLGLALFDEDKATDPVAARPNYVRLKVAYTKGERAAVAASK